MGRFLDAVRNGTIAHPLGRGFDRSAWSKDAATDDPDRLLISSGHAVADLIDAMRPHALLRNADPVLLRALVAYSNREIVSTHTKILQASSSLSVNSISLSNLLRKKLPETGATLSEMTDALGDSFVYPIREAMSGLPATLRDRFTRVEWMNAIELAVQQAILANRWYFAWFFWMDVLWLDAHLLKRNAYNWELVHVQRTEIIRQVSSARREQKLESFVALMTRLPAIKVASTDKTMECLWTRNKLLLRARAVRKGELSWSDRIRHYVFIPEEYFSTDIVDVNLRIEGVIIKVRDAILFYSSLMVFFFEFSKSYPHRKRLQDMHPRDAFCVYLPNLVTVLSDLLEIPQKTITTLITVATFSGNPREILWGKPFLKIDDENRLIFLSALKTSLLRTVSHLIDEYAEDHGRKGIFFQEHCRRVLTEAAHGGPLKDVTWISPRPVDTDSETGDIDICIVIDDVLIVVEVKFISIPSDAYEYWKANQALDDALLQLERKLRFVHASLDEFQKALKQYHAAPEKMNIKTIIPLILSSDAYHAGFPRGDVAVADLSILTTFFENYLVDSQALSRDAIHESGRRIYSSPSEACSVLRQYLLEPEIIKKLLKQTSQRELSYPTGVRDGDEEITVLVKTFDVKPGSDNHEPASATI